MQDILPAHHRAFAPEWQRSFEDAERKALVHKDQVERYYNRSAHPLPEIHVGSNVAVQNSTTKRWDIYGVVTEVSPHRRYYVKTVGGRVLVRNRRFLRRRVPTVTPTCNTGPPPTLHVPVASSQSTAQTHPVTPLPLRRSTRHRARSKRLIEEITF